MSNAAAVRRKYEDKAAWSAFVTSDTLRQSAAEKSVIVGSIPFYSIVVDREVFPVDHTIARIKTDTFKHRSVLDFLAAVRRRLN